MSDRLLSVNELVEKLNISKSTVLNWVREGKIPSIKLGRQWRFRSNDIENWLKGKERQDKSRFSIQGIFEGGGPIPKESIDEAIKEWNKVKESQ